MYHHGEEMVTCSQSGLVITSGLPMKFLSKNAHYGEAVAGKRSVGFEAMPSIAYYCREDFASKVGLRVGHFDFCV